MKYNGRHSTFTIRVIALLFMLHSADAWCQKKSATTSTTKKTTAQTKSESVKIDPDFTPILEPVEKINVLPELEQTNVTKQQVGFSKIESPTSLNGEYVPLAAADIQADYPYSQGAGNIRLGVGNKNSFLGDIQLNLINKEKHALDVNFKHRSIFGDVLFQNTQVERAYHADNDLQINYRTYAGKTMIDAGLGERILFWNNYGQRASYGTDTMIMPKGQWSTDGVFRFSLTSMDMSTPLKWSVGSKGHLFRLGKGVASKNHFPNKTKGGTERDFTLYGKIDFQLNDRFNAHLDATIRNFGYKIPSSFDLNETNPNTVRDLSVEFANKSYFELTPTIHYFYRNWLIKGGIKLSIPSSVTESVHPNFLASAITSLNEKTELTLSLDGGVNPLSYREGFLMNPYLDPSKRIHASWTIFDLKTDLEYRPQSAIRLNPEIGISKTKDAAFFYNCAPFVDGINNTNGRYFGIKYMNSTELHLSLEGSYVPSDLWRISGDLRFNQYANSSDESAIETLLENNGRKAWYKPGFLSNLRFDIQPVDNVSFYINHHFEGLRYAPTRVERISETISQFANRLDAINNFGVGGHYTVRKGVGIFLQIDNLLDHRYEGYYGYPVHGFTAIVGGSVSL